MQSPLTPERTKALEALLVESLRKPTAIEPLKSVRLELAQIYEKLPPRLQNEPPENLHILADHLCIARRLRTFLSQQNPKPHSAHQFLMKALLQPNEAILLDALYEGFKRQLNPLRRMEEQLQTTMAQLVDFYWQRYQNSAYFKIGKTLHATGILGGLGLCIAIQQAPPFALFLPLTALTLLYCGQGADRALSPLLPFISASIQLTVFLYLGTQWIERGYLGIRRNEHWTLPVLAFCALVASLLSHGLQAYTEAQETRCYQQSNGLLTSTPQYALPKAICKAALAQTLPYLPWMILPYLNTWAVLKLLDSARWGFLLTPDWPAYLNDLKLILSITGWLYHERQHATAPSSIRRVFQERKAMHYAIESAFSLLILLCGPSAIKASFWRTSPTTTGLRMPADRQTITTNTRISIGFSHWDFKFLCTQRPDSETVNTPSLELLQLFAKPAPNVTWYANDASLAHGLAASRLDADAEWLQKTFGSRQCPANLVQGVSALLAEELKVIRVLAQTETTLVTQSTQNQATVVLSTVLPHSLHTATHVVRDAPPAANQFLQFFSRAAALEISQAPNLPPEPTSL